MNILVTGGCGFIGSHLVDALIGKGHKVVVLDDLSTGRQENLHPKAQLHQGSTATPGIFQPLVAAADICFHLAAVVAVDRTRTAWHETHSINDGGIVNLFDAIAQSGRKIPVIYASSSAVYGNSNRVPLSEDSSTVPVTPYAHDKLACEHHGQIAAQIHNIPNIGLRFFNVYGPRQDARSPYSGIVAGFIENIARGETVTIYGNGLQSRDFIHVRDAVTALMKAMEKTAKGANPAYSDVVNICTGNGITVRALADAVGNAVGKPPKISHVESRRGDVRASVGDPARADRILNFRATIPLAQGLKKTINP